MELYCIMCEQRHETANYFAFTPIKASNKAHLEFAKRCNCAVCGQGLYNLGRSVSILLNSIQDRKEGKPSYQIRFAQNNIKHFVESIRKNNSLHVIDACNLFTTCPPPSLWGGTFEEWLDSVVDPDQEELNSINANAELLLQDFEQ